MIVVLHRERSEKLARRFAEIIGEQEGDAEGAWYTLATEDQEQIVRAFDALIQDGLISEHQHRPEGRD